MLKKKILAIFLILLILLPSFTFATDINVDSVMPLAYEDDETFNSIKTFINNVIRSECDFDISTCNSVVVYDVEYNAYRVACIVGDKKYCYFDDRNSTSYVYSVRYDLPGTLTIFSILSDNSVIKEDFAVSSSIKTIEEITGKYRCFNDFTYLYGECPSGDGLKFVNSRNYNKYIKKHTVVCPYLQYSETNDSYVFDNNLIINVADCRISDDDFLPFSIRFYSYDDTELNKIVYEYYFDKNSEYFNNFDFTFTIPLNIFNIALTSGCAYKVKTHFFSSGVSYCLVDMFECVWGTDPNITVPEINLGMNTTIKLSEPSNGVITATTADFLVTEEIVVYVSEDGKTYNNLDKNLNGDGIYNYKYEITKPGTYYFKFSGKNGDYIKPIQIVDTILNPELSIQKEQNKLIGEQLEVSKNIFAQIGDLLSYINPFSENFFVYKLIDLLIEALKNLFVPADNFFTNWFDDLNSWLGDRFGIIYFPFEIVFDFLNRVGGLSVNTDYVLHIPDVSINFFGNDITFINAFDYDFNSLLTNDTIKNIHTIYLTIVDVILYLSMVVLAYNTFIDVFGGKSWDDVAEDVETAYNNYKIDKANKNKHIGF